MLKGGAGAVIVDGKTGKATPVSDLEPRKKSEGSSPPGGPEPV